MSPYLLTQRLIEWRPHDFMTAVGTHYTISQDFIRYGLLQKRAIYRYLFLLFIELTRPVLFYNKLRQIWYGSVYFCICCEVTLLLTYVTKYSCISTVFRCARWTNNETTMLLISTQCPESGSLWRLPFMRL